VSNIKVSFVDQQVLSKTLIMSSAKSICY